MIEELVFDFTPDPRRVAAARWRWVVMPVRGIVAGLVGLAGLFVAALHLIIRRSTPVLWVGVLLLVASLVLFVVWFVQNRRLSAGTGLTRMVLDDRGIATGGGAGRSALAWDRFERWLENDDEFVVLSRVGKQRGVTLLPKAGTTESEQERVRELLVEHVEADEEPLDVAFVDDDPAPDQQDGPRGGTA